MMRVGALTSLLLLLVTQQQASGFVSPLHQQRQSLSLSSSNSDDDTAASTATIDKRRPPPQTNEDFLKEETFGGYTVKQRLREEVESPFRKVRLVLFGSSAGSALVALYFSALSTIKAITGGFSDAIPLEDALQSDAINLGAAIICGFLAFREYRVGEANLQRIARGGQLANLVVEPVYNDGTNVKRVSLSQYRRNSRLVIAAGGKEYIQSLALSLTSDQLSDSNILPEKLQETDVIVIPVLLDENTMNVVDTKEYWNNDISVDKNENTNTNRNFDITRANNILAFPRGTTLWTQYLKEDINTAQNKQGFDVLKKGITLVVKKNGKILRRATGLPPWIDIINTMDVLDGKFGMPGDTEKYG